MIQHMAAPRIGADINGPLIAMWTAMQKGWVPPCEVSENEYYFMRDNRELYSPELLGFVGHAGAYAGKYFDTFARGGGRNYLAEGSRDNMKIIKALTDVRFYHASYHDLEIPENSLVYCDPPYYGTSDYGTCFDSEKFYNWCREMSSKGHTVFVSEYSAPGDFLQVWAGSMSKNTSRLPTDKAIEKIYII